MYYDRLKQRVRAVAVARQKMRAARSPVTDHIAACYIPLHEDIAAGHHSIYNLPGGRGSGKSSFVALEIASGLMDTPDTSAIVFRKYANTLRESVFSQIQWAIDELGVSELWRASVSPMLYTYIPTGQQIYFRGLDDAGKLKSIKPRRGRFAFVWFEEFSELNGMNQVRSVLQSVVRGGDAFRIFNSFNPPLSKANWANKYVLTPDERALTFRSTYKMMPESWLGEAFLLEAERLEQINPRAFDHEYMGNPTGTGGEVFPAIQARTITDEEISCMGYFYCGIDWGFSVDPFCFIRAAYDRKHQTIFITDEIYQRGLTNTQAAAIIKERGYDLEPMTGRPGQLMTCDNAEPKSIADMREEGINARACAKWPGSVLYGIRWLQSRYIIIDPARCPNTWREFSEYEYATTKDGEFLADVPDANNHSIDALRYALNPLIRQFCETA